MPKWPPIEALKPTRCRRWRDWPARSAIRMCATAAPSAARSPTTIRPPTTPRRSSGSGATVHHQCAQASPRGQILHRHVRDGAQTPTKSSPPSSFRCRQRAGYAKFPQSRLALCHGRRVRCADIGRQGPGGGHGCGPIGVPVPEMETALEKNFSRRCTGGDHGRRRGPQQRHACLGRIPRPSRECHGPPGGCDCAVDNCRIFWPADQDCGP